MGFIYFIFQPGERISLDFLVGKYNDIPSSWIGEKWQDRKNIIKQEYGYLESELDKVPEIERAIHNRIWNARESLFTYICVRVRSLYNDIFYFKRTHCDSMMTKVNSAADELVDELTELSCTLTLNCKLALTRWPLHLLFMRRKSPRSNAPPLRNIKLFVHLFFSLVHGRKVKRISGFGRKTKNLTLL